jgi:hypothetical protein
MLKMLVFAEVVSFVVRPEGIEEESRRNCLFVARKEAEGRQTEIYGKRP